MGSRPKNENKHSSPDKIRRLQSFIFELVVKVLNSKFDFNFLGIVAKEVKMCQ